MQDTKYLKSFPKKITYGKVYGTTNYIEFGKLMESLAELVSSLKIKVLDFRYERKDKNQLFGHFTNFNFWLESDGQVLIILDCNTNRNTLYHFLNTLKKFHNDSLIDINNWFERDGYSIDISKNEIVRRVYRQEN